MLSLELHGRTNFGGGALDTATFDIAKILIPNPTQIAPDQWKSIRQDAFSIIQRDFLSAKEEFRQSDRKELDLEISHILGDHYSIENLYKAIQQIQDIRLQRARTFRKVTSMK